MSELIENKDLSVVPTGRVRQLARQLGEANRIVIENNNMGNVKSTVRHMLCGVNQTDKSDLFENPQQQSSHQSSHFNHCDHSPKLEAYQLTSTHEIASPEAYQLTSTHEIASPEAYQLTSTHEIASPEAYQLTSTHEIASPVKASDIQVEYDEQSELSDIDNELETSDELSDRELEEYLDESEQHVCNSECEHSELGDGELASDPNDYELDDSNYSDGLYREEIINGEMSADESYHESYDENELSETEGVRAGEEQYAADEAESDEYMGELEEYSDYEAEVEEQSGDEAEAEEYSGDEEEMICCTSECGSDCDGDHQYHVCDSECECEIEQSDNESISEGEIHSDNNGLPVSQTEGAMLDLTESNSKPKPLPRLKGNVCNASDKNIMNELRNAIESRVKRTSSLHEASSAFQPIVKRNGSLPNTDSDAASEHFKKLDVNEREARKKERRTRLRTLELKRESFLVELREGSKESYSSENVDLS